ncbi:MAG: GntR family transcriptional regulator [Rubripirellula sp.]
MFLSIDFQSDVAIYLQIVRQIKFSVAAGTLKPGQLLPSARVLSGRLTVNPNTVARAFSELTTDSVIEALRGRGMVVCEGAVAICRAERDGVLAERIGDSLSEAWHAGLDEKRINKIVADALKRLAKTRPNVHTDAPSADELKNVASKPD